VIRLWTDGSILVNPGGVGGWAFVAERDGDVLHTESGNDPASTNNRMELTAVIEALEWLLPERSPIESVEVISDAQYVVRGITEWRAGWERRDWRKVKNVNLWMRLCSVVDGHGEVGFRWVRGHDGAEFNEMADKLAGEAARSCDMAVTRREFDDDEEHLAELAAGWGS
jgi:ribonuclease HI